MSTSTEIMSALKNETRLTRGAFDGADKSGLKAAVYGAVLAYFARTAHGATAKQITFLLLGVDKLADFDANNGGKAKIYRAAMLLAGNWSAKGLFEPMRGANSFEAATTAALDHLKAHNVTAYGGIGAFLVGGEKAEAEGSTFAQSVARALKACTKTDAKKPLTKADLSTAAELILNSVGFEFGKAFFDAAKAKFDAIAIATAQLASDDAEMVILEEPSENELIAA